jgi:DNA-binding Lrp family transcriptional regulator
MLYVARFECCCRLNGCFFAKNIYLLSAREGVEGVFDLPRAFVVMNVESGAEDEVLKQLKKITGVEEAYFAYGVYDLITNIKADTMENLKDMITKRIRALNKVRSTLTLIMMEE